MDLITSTTLSFIQPVAFVSTASTGIGMKLADGKPRFSDTPYGYDVAEGNLSAHSQFFRIGYISAADNTSGDMWALGATVRTIPTMQSSGQGFMVVSGSTLDVAAGTGARTVIVDYLDTTFTTQSTTVSLSTGTAGGLAGTTANIINAMVINSVRIATAGTGGKAAGVVQVTATSASTEVYRQISAGETRGRTAVYTVPLGNTLYITDINAGTGAGGAGSWTKIKLAANYDLLSASTLNFFLPYYEQIVQYNGNTHFDIPIKIPAKTTVKLIAVTNQSSGMPVECSMRGWIES